MFAFAPSTPLAAAKPALTSSFTAAPVCARPASTHTATTMILRAGLRKQSSAMSRPVGVSNAFGAVGQILYKADKYMAQSVLMQYYKIANPTGEYGVQCTEGSVKGMAEFARVRSLYGRFRASQASPSKRYGDMYENRKQAIVASHECSHEEKQFCGYENVAASYNNAKSEAYATCYRYASPETVEEAAMLRYMDIQQNNAANMTGVYTTACNEGAAKGQAEDGRVAALNTAFRNGQKPATQLLQEKYDQRRQGYAAANGCNYEEGIVCNYPAVGAAFRPKNYGY